MASDNCNGFFAFLGGAVVGCIAALLLAPEKGEKTRRCLKSKIQGFDRAVYLEEEEVADLIEQEAENEGISKDGAKESVS